MNTEYIRKQILEAMKQLENVDYISNYDRKGKQKKVNEAYSILFDLKINTVLKDEIASIVFSEEMTLAKKRIAIRKLKRKGLDPRSVKAFLRLLEYMEM